MKKAISLFLSGIFLLNSSLALAQEQPEDLNPFPSLSEEDLEKIFVKKEYEEIEKGPQCSDYYDFGSVQATLETEISNVTQGVPLHFKAKVQNENSYPIVDVSAFVKIFKKQENQENNQSNGLDLIDQFFIQENINLPANGEKDIEIGWQVPLYASDGEYRISLNLVSQKRVSLLGLTFVGDNTGDTYDFTVQGENPKLVKIDKNTVKIDDQDYFFTGAPPVVSENDPVKIKIDLKNPTSDSQQIPLRWTLYSLDGLLEENRIESKEETVEINPGQTKTLEFEVKDNNHPVYFLVAEASYQDSKSIVNIRFVREEKNKAKINFSAINSFPLKKDQSATVFSCLENYGAINSSSDHQLKLTLLDQNQKVIHAYNYRGPVSSTMMAVKDEFSPKGNYDIFTLRAELFQDGELIEKSEMLYDCNEIDPNQCLSQSLKNQNPILLSSLYPEKDRLKVIIIGLVVILTVISLILVFRKKMAKNKNTFFILAFFLLSSAILAGSLPQKAQAAKSVSWSKTHNVHLIYPDMIAWSFLGRYYFDQLKNPGTRVTYKAKVTNSSTGTEINSGASIPVGTKLKIQSLPFEGSDIAWSGEAGFVHRYSYKDPNEGFEETRYDPYYFSTGVKNGQWVKNASYGYSCTPYNYIKTVKGYGIYIPFSVNPPEVSISSAGSTAGLSCNSTRTECTVTSPGSIRFSVVFSATYGSFYYRWLFHGACYGASPVSFSMIDRSQRENRCMGPQNGVYLCWAHNNYRLEIPQQKIDFSFTASENNRPPNPPTITGPTAGQPDTSYSFNFRATDPDGDPLRYWINWTNITPLVANEVLPVSGFIASGTTLSASRSWSITRTGRNTLHAMACDNKGACSSWASHIITIATATTTPSTTPGKCGTRSKTYDHTVSTWPAGTFCEVGSPVPASPEFPSRGKPTRWQCQSPDGGSSDSGCYAYVYSPPPAGCLPKCDKDGQYCRGEPYSDGCGGFCQGTKNCSWTEVKP